MALSIIVAGTVPMALRGQSASDSVLTRQSSLANRLNLPRTTAYGNNGNNGKNGAMNGGMNNSMTTGTNNAGPAGTYNSFLKNLSSYKLNLSNGFSLKTTEGLSTMSTFNAFNPNSLRRENFMPREELLYGQRFSLGASYNGLNNMFRGGFGGGGMNSRNPGLSLHAGISF
jgi:hypothetical protein